MNSPEKFWMVYGMNQGQPIARHKSFESAKSEANRLARKVPGVCFYVLEAVAACEKVDVRFHDLRTGAGDPAINLDPEIPF